MGPPNLLMICVAAFFAVFLLLAFLALVMKILTNIFPEKEIPANVFPEKLQDGLDSATLAAISASMSAVFPQTKITKVEQVR